MSLDRAIRVSQQKRFLTPTVKVDFGYVAANWEKTHPYSGWYGAVAKAEIAELRVYCKLCHEELKYQDAFDAPKCKFYCQAVKDAYGWTEYGCGSQWEQHEIDKMSKDKLASLFYTVPHVTGEPISIVDSSGFDGVKRFSFTRPANEMELADYYHKGLLHFREQLKKGPE